MPVPPEGYCTRQYSASSRVQIVASDHDLGLLRTITRVPSGHLLSRLGRAGRRRARSCGLIARGSSRLLSPGVGWRIARILVDREARISVVVTVLSRSRRRGDLGFDFTSGRSGLPDDLKPPIIAGPNAVIDRRGLAIGDHFLSGALGVVARREA